MAKLKSHNFYTKSLTGEELKFISEVKVDVNGRFSLTIIDDILDVCMKSSYSANEIGIDVKQKLIIATNLNVAVDFINRAMNEALTAVRTEEPVIVYSYRSEVAYAKDPDTDEFHTSRLLCKHAEFKGGLHATNQVKRYTIGLSARVYIKVIYTRANTTRITYEYLNSSHALKLGDYAYSLNSFIGIAMHPDGNPRHPNEELKELPYTEESAKFFYDAMLSICKLADRLEGMFEPDNLLAHIRNSGKLLT